MVAKAKKASRLTTVVAKEPVPPATPSSSKKTSTMAAVSPKTPIEAKARKLTAAGQPFLSEGLCLATSRQGVPCLRPRGEDGVPYCRQHMKTGDPSFRVVTHPMAGKILVAARDLPQRYRIALWGQLKNKKDMTQKAQEWAFTIDRNQQLDPTKEKGSLVQFCPCAGPSEIAAVTPVSGGTYRGKKYGCWVFETNQRLQQNWQLTMQYGSNSKESEDFFAERGIKRCDVGTPKYPALRRSGMELKPATEK